MLALAESLKVTDPESMNQCMIRGGLISKHEALIEIEETAEISHVDCTFICVTVVTLVRFDEELYLVTQCQEVLYIESLYCAVAHEPLYDALIILLG